MSAKVVTENSFENDVIESSRTKPVLVDFWATWCPPCKMLSPLLEQIADEKSESLQVVKIDTDENQALSQKYNIMSIPTMILFKDGEPVKQLVGYMPKDRLIAQLGI